MTRFLAITTALALVASPLRAQGALSNQGFGFAPGELSARAQSTGGAFGPFDAQTPINDAALGSWGRMGAYLMYAPEIGTLSVNGKNSSTTTERFPLFAFGLPVGTHVMLGISTATFLDRTWMTDAVTREAIGPDSIDVDRVFSSEGAINDVRLAGVYGISPTLRVGAGVHAYTGGNRLSVRVNFPDSSGFQGFSQFTGVNYAGSAFSAGADWRPMRTLDLALSGRTGGTITAREADSTLGKGHIPNRVDGALKLDAIPGASIAVHYSWEGWSSMQALGSDSARVRDVTEIGVGTDFAGPKLGDNFLQLRVGGRWRQLPYLAAGQTVKEVDFAAGAGLPVASQRAMFDFSLERARRTSSGSVRESSWTIGIGITVRP